MLIEEIENIKSEKSDLRKFGITFGVVLGLLAGALWWRGKDFYSLLVIISLVFFVTGLFVPVVLKPLQKAWMTLAVVLGWFMTRLILSVLFYLVFTSIGLIAKLLGKRFLDIKLNGEEKSYWICRETKPFVKKNYERQF
ncbi:MAG: SxtJ family membrane protein [Candidatus Hodarchaeales archaeon]|jgi:hypothetical protein